MKVAELLSEEIFHFKTEMEVYLTKVEDELTALGDVMSTNASKFALAAWKKGNIEPKRVAQIIVQKGI